MMKILVKSSGGTLKQKKSLKSPNILHNRDGFQQKHTVMQQTANVCKIPDVFNMPCRANLIFSRPFPFLLKNSKEIAGNGLQLL